MIYNPIIVTSIRSDEGGSDAPPPPDPPPGSVTALVPFDILLQHSVIRAQQLLAIDARSELETQSL